MSVQRGVQPGGWCAQVVLCWLTALCLAVLLAPAAFAQTASAAAGRGHVEEASTSAEPRQLVLSGWIAPERPNVFVTNLIVQVAGQEIYRGRMHRFERPDVVQSTGRRDWLLSGFHATISLPLGLPTGPQPLEVSVRLGDGSTFALNPAPRAARVLVPALTQPPRSALLAALLALLVPLAVLVFADPIERVAGRQGWRAGLAPKAFAASVAGSFALLVALGLTGSSLALVFHDAPPQSAVVAPVGQVPWAGEPRPVRSDEWQVITPLALAQLAHQPRLPVLNRNLGPDGENMLVIGMTGVPVAHLSALAKPATWGFFVLDLRRALAWYWWFPFFACFGALALLLRRLFALDWRIAVGLSTTIALAPYAVVFSGWPAYIVFFAAAALLLAERLLHARRWLPAAGLGAALGLALTGYALVLYPAWQISLAWLFGSLALGWGWNQRRMLVFGRVQAVGMLLALVVLAVLLGSWWHSAHDAVEAIRGTVYPGQRSAEVGGDIDRWFLVKGLLSPLTMYLPSAATNASDAGSFLFMLPAAGIAVLLAWWRARRIDGVPVAIATFLLMALSFMFIGWPVWLASATLWSSTTSYRMDLALGVAQVLLLAWLLAPRQQAEPSSPLLASNTVRFIAALIALGTILPTVWQLQRVPPEIQSVLTPAFLLLTLAALGASAYLLLMRQTRAFTALFCGWTLASAVPFNPLAQAPQALVLDPELARQMEQGATAETVQRRMAVIDQRNWAMTLPAAGVPVLNGVFYHPQPGLWRKLDPDGKQRVLHNRYQRLLLTLGSLEGRAAHRIDSPRLDEVVVTLDPARFDFSLLDSAFVLAPLTDAGRLRANATLMQVETASAGHVLYRIVPSATAARIDR